MLIMQLSWAAMDPHITFRYPKEQTAFFARFLPRSDMKTVSTERQIINTYD